MTDSDEHAPIAALEERLMHQEAAIDELTRTVLHQEQLLTQQRTAIERLEAMVRALSGTHTPHAGDEPPPPHY